MSRAEWDEPDSRYLDDDGNALEVYGEPEDKPYLDDWDEDGHQRYKDDLASGYINPDGSQRDPDEPDWGAEEHAEHCDEHHGGNACDCPRPPIEAWPDGPDYADEPPF